LPHTPYAYTPTRARRYHCAEERAAPEEKPTGPLTVGECLRLAKALTDHAELPASCREYIEKTHAIQKAYDGAGGNMVRSTAPIQSYR
jgi:hypothetical protein